MRLGGPPDYRYRMRYACFVIKARVEDPQAASFCFEAQRTMYGGKTVAVGDLVFVFASEHEGGAGLAAMGVVTAAKAVPLRPGVVRQTPRVSVNIRRTALPKCRLGRADLKVFTQWGDGRPETELNFKFYRQATNKIGGISEAAVAFLTRCF